MKNLTAVAVLLTTYNSEQFLNELIESILGQDNSDWTLFISDDGSGDGTGEILNFYVKNNKDKVVFIDFPEKNTGASLSFERLLRRIDSSYYMFCDHDDVWLPNKISLSLSAMKAAELELQRIPVLVHTDLTVVDHQLNIIDRSFSAYSGINPEKFVNNTFLSVANCVTGCTIMLNDPAKKIILPVPNSSIMYDWWIALNVVQKGKIIYIPEQTVLYRQHDKNVIGAKKAGIKYIASTFVHFNRTIRADYNTIKALGVFGNFGVIKYIYYKLLFQFKRYFR